MSEGAWVCGPVVLGGVTIHVVGVGSVQGRVGYWYEDAWGWSW